MNPLDHGEPKLCVLDIQCSQTFGSLGILGQIVLMIRRHGSGQSKRQLTVDRLGVSHTCHTAIAADHSGCSSPLRVGPVLEIASDLRCFAAVVHAAPPAAAVLAVVDEYEPARVTGLDVPGRAIG